MYIYITFKLVNCGFMIYFFPPSLFVTFLLGCKKPPEVSDLMQNPSRN